MSRATWKRRLDRPIVSAGAEHQRRKERHPETGSYNRVQRRRSMHAGIHGRRSCATIAVTVAMLVTTCPVALSPRAAGAAGPALSSAGGLAPRSPGVHVILPV